MKTNIQLICAKHCHDYESILALSPGNHLIFACDFHIDGIEIGERLPGGYGKGRIINIDHHAQDERMFCHVTSTQLAIDWVANFGTVDSTSAILIDHTDCDSMLSSAILSGILPPDPVFANAALTADHTGEKNQIADLLQSLDPMRDYALSIRNLELLRKGLNLDEAAMVALKKRERDREYLQAEFHNKAENIQKVALVVGGQRLDTIHLPSLFPQAAVIIYACPGKTDSSRWTMKIRMGNAAPNGFILDQNQIRLFDPNYGGRWNAGSNSRGGGTSMDPRTYALKLIEVTNLN